MTYGIFALLDTEIDQRLSGWLLGLAEVFQRTVVQETNEDLAPRGQPVFCGPASTRLGCDRFHRRAQYVTPVLTLSIVLALARCAYGVF